MTPQFAIRLPLALRKALEKKASKDGRTLSNLIIKVLTDWISDQKK